MPPLVDYRLANGLRVVLAEDHTAPIVAVTVWYHVGAANDPTGRSGLAHLLEHLMAAGSAHVRPGQFDRLLEAAGAENNAYTDADKTAYHIVAPAHQLPLALWLESERLGSLKIGRTAFETQRRVVLEELSEIVANAPYGASNQRFEILALQGYPPYERPVIGLAPELAAATLAEVRTFHAAYYHPGNATLVIAGDFETDLARRLVGAYFGPLPAGPPVTPILQRYLLPPQLPIRRTDPVTGCRLGAEEVWIDPLAELPRYAATIAGPPRGQPGFYPLDLLADILGNGDSSRLKRNLVQAGLAAEVSVDVSAYLGASTLDIIAYPLAGEPLERLSGRLRAEFEAIITQRVAETELARAKRQLLAEVLANFRSSVQDTAEGLQEAVLIFGDPQGLVAEMALYEAVTLADIQQAARTYLCDRPLNVLVTLPAGETVLAPYPGRLSAPVGSQVSAPPGPAVLAESPPLPPETADRTAPPAALPLPASRVPAFETFHLDNGLTIILVEQHKVPQLSLQLYLGGSNTAAPAEQQGVADLAADLLARGTRHRSAAELAGTLEAVGGSVETSAGVEWLALSVSVLSPEADLAFELLADMALHATFPPAELEVQKARTLTFLEQAAADPFQLADRHFRRIIFSAHPYGLSPTPATVKGLSRADVAVFYHALAKPNNALLVIAGDLTLAEARRQAERVFAGWQPGPVPDFLAYSPIQSGDTSAIYLVDRPDSEQATLQVGNLALNARNPDRYALAVVNAILGGTFTSRLNRRLREDKGYTYGVESGFAQANATGTFRVLTDVGQPYAADALRQILHELQRIRARAVTAPELTRAKGYLAGNFLLELENPVDLAEQLAHRHLTGVPLDELYAYLPRLAAITAAQARAAARRYIQADAPLIVVVGDAAILQPQLESLGRPVVVLPQTEFLKI